MPFFAKWTRYYYNHETETVNFLFLDETKIRVLDSKVKQSDWYKWYNKKQEQKREVYIWYIVYSGKKRIGAVNFAGNLNECEALFFLIPEFRGKDLAYFAYFEAEIALLNERKVKYIWGEAQNKGSSKLFQDCWFNKMGIIEEYYKYTQYYKN